ncbi:MAG TPA: hypothetical protein VIM55_03510 [Mucilaginibacter sp.]
MNWKLIFQLSVFGLIMAFGTVSLIPEKIEPLFWALIFIFCSWVIVRAAPGKYFLHGFMAGLFNCVWITAVHYFFYRRYMDNHPRVDSMTASIPPPFTTHPRIYVSLVGLSLGVLSAVVFGLFAFIASKIARKK